MIKQSYDAIIIGAGAAGMMCGAVAGQGGRSILLLDHAKAPGEKIRISGGGRCNFTNLYSGPENFISTNPHFCKSALAGYSPRDFIGQVDAQKIAWHEKSKGQLFCDGRATQIVHMLLAACEAAGNAVQLGCEINAVRKTGSRFEVTTSEGTFFANALVIACGGPSIPKMGASGFGYQIAEQFGLKVIRPRAALVPLIFSSPLKESMQKLAGVSLPVIARHDKTQFAEAMLFTHRGLSGPAILQISSYIMPGERLMLNLVPDVDMQDALKKARNNTPKQSPGAFLSTFLPQRLAASIADEFAYTRLADMSDKALFALAQRVNAWQVIPTGNEGFRTAEVTLGGVDTNALSSKTLQAKTVPGLYFIGEVVDVTGHLGGHNFQWAWASGVAAGRAIGEPNIIKTQ
jgi:predicted Rossmann fold flavoprotein